MAPYPPDMSQMAALAAMMGHGLGQLEDTLKQHPKIDKGIQRCDPIKSASVFAQLLTEPSLQANCLRLETLTHLCLAKGRGTVTPTLSQITDWFAELGLGRAGMMEDPSEDLFVKIVKTPKGNFRIFEGIWEGNTFYLQRLINAVLALKPKRISDEILEPVYAILILSDEICERKGLTRYTSGDAFPKEKLLSPLALQARNETGLLRFDLSDLKRLGVDLESLSAFGFLPSHKDDILEQSIGHTNLERFPLIYKDGHVTLLLPTAVSVAIRRFVFDYFDNDEQLELLSRILYTEFNHLIGDTQFFGKHFGAYLGTLEGQEGRVVSALAEIDTGRYIQLVAIIDDLEGFDDSGHVGTHPSSERYESEIDAVVDKSYQYAKSQPNYRGMICVFTSISIGRGANFKIENKSRDRWRSRFISFHDLIDYSNVNEFTPQTFWRIADAEDALKAQNISVVNYNGILNVAAWLRRTKGQLVPHHIVPEDYNGEGFMFNFDQNALKDIRLEAAFTYDEHYAPYVDGSLLSVRRFGDGYFEEERETPLYAELDYDKKHGIRLLYISEKQHYWVEVYSPNSENARFKQQKWEVLKTWLPRVITILEENGLEIENDVVLMKCHFLGTVPEPSAILEVIDYAEVLESIKLDTPNAEKHIEIMADEIFDKASYHESNIAERALVRRMIEGFYRVSKAAKSSADIDEILKLVVPNTMARQAHVFQAEEVRDYLQDKLPQKIVIDENDHALETGDVGWKFRERSEGNQVRGKAECTQFLNKITKSLLSEVCNELGKFERQSFLHKVILNYEAAVKDKRHWRRTSSAVVSLRKDQEASKKVIIDNEHELNGVFQASRILIEMGISECSLGSGEIVGAIDLSRMMAKVMHAIQIGGNSDAIHWEAMQPLVQISPLGELQFNFDFYEQVLTPYVTLGTSLSIDDNIARYGEHTKPKSQPKAINEVLPPEFINAIKSQLGFSLSELAIFVEYLEDQAIKSNAPILRMKYSELLNPKTNIGTLSEQTAKTIIDELALKPRNSWSEVPEEFLQSDIDPWKFKRRLSVLRKPLIQLDEEDDPSFMIAPGIIRESFRYQFDRYYEGEFPMRQLVGEAMRTWKSHHIDGKVGEKFEKEVLSKVKELRWEAKHSVNITEIFGKKLEKNYGEIDILAWKPEANEVTIIECKDVQHRKTSGEIAEQLSDFRGKVRANGRPDLLLKHLRRVELLTSHADVLKSYLKLDKAPSIDSIMVFRNPVPMMWAWQQEPQKTKICFFKEIPEFL